CPGRHFNPRTVLDRTDAPKAAVTHHHLAPRHGRLPGIGGGVGDDEASASDFSQSAVTAQATGNQEIRNFRDLRFEIADIEDGIPRTREGDVALIVASNAGINGPSFVHIRPSGSEGGTGIQYQIIPVRVVRRVVVAAASSIVIEAERGTT